MFDGKSILVTGGTGTFGTAFVKYLLSISSVRRVIVFSRDEMKQWDMRAKLDDQRLRFFIGDVRDLDRLLLALNGVDYVVHAAAMKIIDSCESNPFEAVKTNVLGAMNLVQACIVNRVSRIVALSTDKASAPTSLYGATKLCSDRIFSSASNYFGNVECKVNVVRYGNVVGSRGSLLPILESYEDGEVFSLTHPKMTRFVMFVDEAVQEVVDALGMPVSGVIRVKKQPSVKIEKLIKTYLPHSPIKLSGLRDGEKIAEQLVGIDEAASTFETDTHYIIAPSKIARDHLIEAKYSLVQSEFQYRSDENPWFLEPQVLIDKYRGLEPA